MDLGDNELPLLCAVLIGRTAHITKRSRRNECVRCGGSVAVVPLMLWSNLELTMPKFDLGDVVNPLTLKLPKRLKVVRWSTR